MASRHKKGKRSCFRLLSVTQKRLSLISTLYVATKTSRIPRNLNFLGETAFWGGIFCLEYPSRRSEKVNFHFANYRFSFRKLQIFISQTTDFHFANYRFSFRFVPFRFAPFRFANYSKPGRCRYFRNFPLIYFHTHVHTFIHGGLHIDVFRVWVWSSWTGGGGKTPLLLSLLKNFLTFMVWHPAGKKGKRRLERNSAQTRGPDNCKSVIFPFPLTFEACLQTARTVRFYSSS